MLLISADSVYHQYIKLASDPALNLIDAIEREKVARKIYLDDPPSYTASEGSLPLNLPKVLEGSRDAKLGFQAFKTVKMRTQDSRPTISRCPVSQMPSAIIPLEQDFTTPGVEGSLECPFSRMAKHANEVPTPPQDVPDSDPIAAEFHPELVSRSSVDAPPSATGTAGKCPIRYLDQHSPEEVAQYFENHKHEIPRSHEICVKRYQKNTISIRELDSKYGNLVSMIQGLGVKHQQFLPSGAEPSIGQGVSSSGAVEKWADHVSRPIHVEAVVPAVITEEDDRDGRFQRPLREVRVGESPSRPWGISVPLAHEEPLSPEPAPVQPTFVGTHEEAAAPINDDDTKPKCPFDHKKAKLRDPPVTVEASGNTSTKPDSPQPPMIFNGPVFFGYTAEQAAVMLKAMSNDVTRAE